MQELTEEFIQITTAKVTNSYRKYRSAKKIRLMIACNMEQIVDIAKAVGEYGEFGMVILSSDTPICAASIVDTNYNVYDLTLYPSLSEIKRKITKLILQGRKTENVNCNHFHKIFVLIIITLGISIEKEFMVNELCTALNSQFVPCGLYNEGGDCTHFIYSNSKMVPVRDPQRMAFFCHGANGDIIMMLPLLQAFIRQEREKGSIPVLLASTELVYKYLQLFIRDAEVVNLDSLPGFSQMEPLYLTLYYALENSGEYKKILNLPVQLTPNPVSQNTYEQWSQHMSLHEHWADEADLMENSQILQKADFSAVKYIPEIESELRAIKQKYRWIIGLQYYSDSLLVNGKYTRAWPYEYAREFVEKCHRERIGVLTLVPDQEKKLPYVHTMGEWPIINLFQIIPYTNAVVGVDSCCAHIAGVLGIQNITINGNAVHILRKPYIYRPLSNNYSIYSKNGFPSDISAEIVFQRLKSILEGKIKLQTRIITMQDSLNGVGIEWIGDALDYGKNS